ncbi:MAG: pyridoxamine 5'-phosphate oxidase family protein [Bacteroidales bacterium]|jgi:general stress protein 26|nr:pyridoxamine 5'-phosphate oxidase family protein [Bacteroidales bacterium]
MENKSAINRYIEEVLKPCRFAVLATEGNGQPHTSLIAITPYGSFGQLIFATYRNTLKYRNLTHNSKVAVLIESRDANMKGLPKSIVLTIIGHTEEISITENESAYEAHLNLHPEMESFMRSPDCALILVIAQSYQVVNGIDDIRWITADDLDAI